MSTAPAPTTVAIDGYRFSAPSRVEIADTDLGAVVYYGRYPLHVDRGVLAYRRHLGIPALGPEGHLFVVRRLEVEYRSSARFDEELEVFVRTAELGRTSHTAQVLIARPGDAGPEPVAEARLVIVGLDGYGGRPSRMPGGMRDAIAAFEGLAA
ncbi:MAG: thioesterase family protein [Miltoncostaeaceae bacterium]